MNIYPYVRLFLVALYMMTINQKKLEENVVLFFSVKKRYLHNKIIKDLNIYIDKI